MSHEIYSFVSVTAGGDRRGGQYDYQTLFVTRNQDEFQEMCQILLERRGGFRRDSYTRNRRSIKVVKVDKDKHEHFVKVSGRNGLKSQQVKPGQKFGSAAEASGILGLRHNEVAMALSRAGFTGENEATLRGVTLAYADKK